MKRFGIGVLDEAIWAKILYRFSVRNANTENLSAEVNMSARIPHRFASWEKNYARFVVIRIFISVRAATSNF